MTSSLYGPMLALIAWTGGVGMLAARRRVREIRRRRIPLATLARPETPDRGHERLGRRTVVIRGGVRFEVATLPGHAGRVDGQQDRKSVV